MEKYGRVFTLCRAIKSISSTIAYQIRFDQKPRVRNGSGLLQLKEKLLEIGDAKIKEDIFVVLGS